MSVFQEMSELTVREVRGNEDLDDLVKWYSMNVHKPLILDKLRINNLSMTSFNHKVEYEYDDKAKKLTMRTTMWRDYTKYNSQVTENESTAFRESL